MLFFDDSPPPPPFFSRLPFQQNDLDLEKNKFSSCLQRIELQIDNLVHHKYQIKAN